MDLTALHQQLNREDLETGRVIDTKALTAERVAITNCGSAEGSALLGEAIRLWRVAHRADRAAALEAALINPLDEN